MVFKNFSKLFLNSSSLKETISENRLPKYGNFTCAVFGSFLPIFKRPEVYFGLI
jgi:hypothetical protein